VDHFYDKKKKAEIANNTSERFLIKMILNNLYGYFGRSRELLTTKFVTFKTLKDLIRTTFIKSITEIKDDLYIVVIKNNLNSALIKELKLKIG
jgi:hypothetical protein